MPKAVQRRAKLNEHGRAVDKKCKRIVGDVYSVFSFECESWSWSQQVVEWIQRLGHKYDEMNLSFQQEGRRDAGGELHENGKTGTFADNLWRSLGARNTNERCDLHVAACFRMEEHLLVDRYESPQHVVGPQQSHQMAARMGVARSWMCMGQKSV